MFTAFLVQVELDVFKIPVEIEPFDRRTPELFVATDASTLHQHLGDDVLLSLHQNL